MRLDLIGRKDLPIEFGRWKLTALLGEGGMARVFRGELRGGAGFRKPAAVKVVLPGIGDRAAQMRKQLLQEARVGALLNHPNIVQTFDCGELEGYPFIAMELVEGVGLQELVQGGGRLPPGPALDIAAQVASGLHHAHTATHEGRELRVIHRDVKPSNILIRADGVAKVVDFGIAKASVDDALSTSTGMTKGTPAYMSPEQLGADPLDARSDLFALGAVLYYLLFGRTLFSGHSITEVMLRIIQVDETLASRGVFEKADELLPGLAAVLRRLLVKDPERRFPNGAVAAKALLELRAQLPEHPSTTELVGGFLSERDAGKVFGSPTAGPNPDASAGGPSDFERRLEEAEAGGVDWVAGEGDGDATRLVPVHADDLEPSKPVAEVGPTRAMPSVRVSVPPADEFDAWEQRSRGTRRLRRVLMAGLMLGVVCAVGTFFWLPDRSETTENRPARVVAEPAAAFSESGVDPIADLTEGAARQQAEPPRAKLREKKVPLKSPNRGEAPDAVDSDDTRRDAIAAVDTEEDAVASADDEAGVRGVPEVDPVTASAEDDVDDAVAGQDLQDEEDRINTETGEAVDRVPGEADSDATITKDAVAPLRMSHRPFTMATVGTSKTIQVYVAGPDDASVVVRWGPAGDADRTLTLSRAGTGVWEGLLPITAEFRDVGLEYWIVVTHPSTTPKRLQSGSPEGPHKVTVF